MGASGTSPNAATEHEVVDGAGPYRPPVEHFTAAERVARGKGARGEVPRSSHAMMGAVALRRSPIELLEDQAKERLPELGPIRYGRMLESPFTFFRGAAYLMAADLADGTRTGLHAQLCGDAHLSNFGVFRALGSEARLQHQRLRRDAAGPVRVGRQAAGSKHRGRRPRSRLRRGRPAVRRAGDASVATGRRWRDFATMRKRGRLVHASRRRSDRASGSGRRAKGKELQRFERNDRKGARRRTACERLRSCARWSTASRGSSRARR